MSSKVDLHLDWCSIQAARYACENWHYSKKLQLGKTARIGVWENGQFIGILLFTNGSGQNIAKCFDVQPNELCELARVALTKHKTEVTRIVSIGLRMIKKQFPKLKVIVSYADPAQNHHGGIYQGGNWLYLGKTATSRRYFDKTGKEYHCRSVSPSGLIKRNGKMMRCKKTDDLTVLKTPGKFKYVLFLDETLKQRFLHLKKPYPKCVTSIESDAVDFQSK